MKLDAVDPELFAILVNWMYHRAVTNPKSEQPDLVTCAELLIYADRFLMTDMQKDTMKTIHSILKGNAEEPGFENFAALAGGFRKRQPPSQNCSQIYVLENEIFRSLR